MSENEKKHLFDILNSIREIQEYTTGISAIEDYLKNRLVMRAVERMLGIIGEATNRLGKESSTPLLSDALKITGLRNRVIHAYDYVDNQIIWEIIQERLPELKQEIEEILKNEL